MKKTHTLKQLITIAMTIILLFLVLTMILVFSASSSIINKHTSAVGSATLNYYRAQLDSTLERVDTFCKNTVSEQLSAVDQAEDEVDLYRWKVDMGSTLSAAVSLSENLYFSMAVTEHEGKALTVVRSRCSSMSHSDALQAYLTEMAANPDMPGDLWVWLEIDGAWYLTRLYRYGSDFCAVCVDSSVLSMAEADEDGLYLFCRQNGHDIAYNTAVQQALSADAAADEILVNGHTYSSLSTNTMLGDFSIHCLVSSATSDMGRYLMQQGFVLLVFCLAMLFCFSLLIRFATAAFSTLDQACAQVTEGDLSTEITRTGHFTEENQIYNAFNNMIRQIKELRIDLYEQALHAQRSKLGFLRMQIKSHFFVNCLTVIHSLAMVGNTALIQEFALCLADYFRYLGSGFSDTVRFGSELLHLHNFVKLQQIRYPDRITYHYKSDPKLASFELLPMIPHTFVENVFKHALWGSVNIELSIEARAGENGGMWLEIRDNGPGFTEEQLVTLNAPCTTPQNTSGTGIANTKERLHLFYAGRSVVQFENHPEGGAIVRVFFPEVHETEAAE